MGVRLDNGRKNLLRYARNNASELRRVDIGTLIIHFNEWLAHDGLGETTRWANHHGKGLA